MLNLLKVPSLFLIIIAHLPRSVSAGWVLHVAVHLAGWHPGIITNRIKKQPRVSDEFIDEVIWCVQDYNSNPNGPERDFDAKYEKDCYFSLFKKQKESQETCWAI